MYLPETDPIKHFSWLTFFRFSLLPKLGHFIINNFLYVINTQVSSENLKMKKKKVLQDWLLALIVLSPTGKSTLSL